MRANGSPASLRAMIVASCPEVEWALKVARGAVGFHKKEVLEYQAAALYALVRPYDGPGRRMLEIGTYYGYTATLMTLGAPAAHLITLNPLRWEFESARRSLKRFPNVMVVEGCSWDYLATTETTFDFVFVDGDHNSIERDIPWFDRLNEGGCILFHDYAPAEALYKPCVPVYNGVRAMAKRFGREPDVLIVDDRLFGMAGFIRRSGEWWGGECTT